MPLILKLLRIGFIGFFSVSVLAIVAVLGSYVFLAPGLPDVASLKEVRLQTPLRIYSADHKLMAVYGQIRRKPLRYEEIPRALMNAFISAEDDRFYQHPGVDYQGLLRAVYHLIKTGEKGQGGSTITMQLTRNFFLTRERSYIRKLREIYLALGVERELSKQDILELYLNKIYLGSHAYGIGAAAEIYYGQDVNGLNLAQMAMIAGLPKAPSTDNPLANPEAARQRRNYVLSRMLALGYITQQKYMAAIDAPVVASIHGPEIEVHAPYVAEMVRAKLYAQFGEDIYSQGFSVQTTIQSSLQSYANQAVFQGLMDYDERHGYRGPEAHLDAVVIGDTQQLQKKFEALSDSNGLRAAVVLKLDGQQATVATADNPAITLSWDGIKWARKYINENTLGTAPKTASDVLKIGDIVRIRKSKQSNWELSQLPEIEGALVSLRSSDGAIASLVGGFDFNRSKFNRATQARRQPGSSFKPFVYSAALDQGFTPATLINDAPVVFNDPALEKVWRPQNYSGKFYGPTRMREALIHSRNMVSIRLLSSIGQKTAIQHIAKFGFDPARLPRDLTLALGSGAVTPMELAAGYAVFSNGGYRVTPHFINRIDSSSGKTIYQANPAIACDEDCTQSPAQNPGNGTPQQNHAQRVIPAENIYQMVSMMQDVIKFGTGRKALVLDRSDLAGKTGTTNDQYDAWFSGYNRDLVATVWVGFDKIKPLGVREVGGVAALPMWISYMGDALKGKPEHSMQAPEDIIRVQIDPVTGLLASENNPDAIWEVFQKGYQPTQTAADYRSISPDSGNRTIDVPEQLF